MVQQAERTAKKWKRLQIVATLLTLLGGAWFAYAVIGDASPASLFDRSLWGAWGLMGAGVALSLFTQLGALWRQG